VKKFAVKFAQDTRYQSCYHFGYVQQLPVEISKGTVSTFFW